MRLLIHKVRKVLCFLEIVIKFELKIYVRAFWSYEIFMTFHYAFHTRKVHHRVSVESVAH